MEVLKEFAVILGGTAAGVSAIAYLAKSLMSHLLSKDLEQHKLQLDAQTKQELERFRAEMVKQNLEHEVKYRRVDEKVSEHLAEIYSRLFTFYESVLKYVTFFEFGDEPTKEEKLESATKANKEFWDYLLPNRIYVPPKLFVRIKDLADNLGRITNDFTRGQRREEKGISGPEDNYWEKASKSIEEEAIPLLADLVTEFHRRLGVQDIEEDTNT